MVAIGEKVMVMVDLAINYEYAAYSALYHLHTPSFSPLAIE